ncbi:MAG: hypothetical protein KAI70_00670 [Candidatus Omnitrophica bacterium]|nr:hypothetical protein [Candidatus Omnitrophota bacterium]
MAAIKNKSSRKSKEVKDLMRQVGDLVNQNQKLVQIIQEKEWENEILTKGNLEVLKTCKQLERLTRIKHDKVKVPALANKIRVMKFCAELEGNEEYFFMKDVFKGIKLYIRRHCK